MNDARRAKTRPPKEKRRPQDRGKVPTRGRNQRRALSHIGGAIVTRCDDPELTKALEAALEVNSDERETRAHLHGFHSYPARLHPQTARKTIEALSKPGDVVLDPFCGSGTVLLEAQSLGRKPIGSDLNPLSVMLCRFKCERTSESQREKLAAAAAKAAEHANDRRAEKAGPTRKYPPADRQWFDIHVLLELDGLKAGIHKHSHGGTRDALMLVLSSIMTKVSRKPGDSGRGEVRKRLASGYTIRMFERRVKEVCKQQAEYEAILPPRVSRARVTEADARQLQALESESVDLVVCSPPYPGVFDYLDHHAIRLSWLGLKTSGFARGEIGSRRGMAELGDNAYERWRSDFARVLRALKRVSKPQASIVLVMADSVVGHQAVFADDLTRDLARELGLEVRAICSQPRPYFHQKTAKAFARRPRKEHLVVLHKVTP
jgi:DNA modification methylase